MDDIIVKTEGNGVNKKTLYIAAGIIIALAIIAGVLYYFNLIPRSILKTAGIKKPQVIEENLVIPDTQKITGGEGKTVDSGSGISVPLVPKDESEQIIVTKAVLTVKGTYDLARTDATTWSPDAKLAFIKSLGAITLGGKSSQWQAVFVSKTKTGMGYEIIIQADQIVSKKEIPSKATGADTPAKNWYDSDGAIKSLQTMPQFFDATVSSITFSYDTDSKKWIYALSTSRGATAMTVD